MILMYEKAGALQTVEFDATVREVHLGTATPAEHPVQNEPDKTDNVKAEKIRLSADCVVSNTPILESIGNVRGQYLPLTLTTTNREQVTQPEISGGPGPSLPYGIQTGSPVNVKPAEYRDTPVQVSGSVLQFPEPFDRVRDVYAELTQLRKSGTRLQVITELTTYPDMVIVSVSAPVQAKQSITFGLELVEVFVGEATLVDAPVPLERRAQATKAQGTQATYELSGQKQTLLDRGVEKLVGVVAGL